MIIAILALVPFSTLEDPISGGPGSASAPPARSGPVTQDVAVFSADDDARCCVHPLPRDQPITTVKGRCGYSVCVVHFRKSCNNGKVGSQRNGLPVI